MLPLVAPDPAAAAWPVRKSINSLTPTEITSLRRGVAVMMSRNTAPRTSADFRRSWVYWANMHAHFGASCRGGKVGSGLTSVELWEASTSAERATWCKCEHGTTSFLTWHRMFLFYFEQVLREASGDPSLSLPYWDYATDPLLPLAFREATYVDEYGQTLPNPLRVEARRQAINNGTAGIAAATASSSNAMAATDYVTFGTRLEGGPHGPVHCALPANGCPNGLMGSVPAAALDPIFYLHHANMDRLYECWLKVDQPNRLPTDPAVRNRTYSFVDATGAVRLRYVRDMLTTGQLHYSYTAGAGCPVPLPPVEPPVVVAADGTTLLGTGQTAVPMSTAPTARTAAPAPKPAQTVTVVIEGFTAAKVPGVNYNVYIAGDSGQRALLGVIDFFGFDPGGGSGAHKHGGATRRYEFDATAAFADLGLRTDKTPKLVFEPSTGLTNSTPDAAAKAIPAGANVRFAKAWVRVAPAK